MTEALGGVHVDVDMTVEDIGPELRKTLRKPAEQAGREVEKILAKAGERSGTSFAKSLSETVRGTDRQLTSSLDGFLPGAGNAGTRAAREFVTRFGAVVDTIGAGLAGRFRKAGDDGGSSFAASFTTAASRIASTLGNRFGVIGERAGTTFQGRLLTALRGTDRQLARSLDGFLPEAGNAATRAASEFVSRFSAVSRLIGSSLTAPLRRLGDTSGLEFSNSFATAINKSFTGIANRLGGEGDRAGRSFGIRFGAGLTAALGGVLARLVQAGANAGTGLAEGLRKGFAPAVSGVVSLIGRVVSAVTSLARGSVVFANLVTAIGALGPVLAGVGAAGAAAAAGLLLLPAAGFAAAASVATATIAFQGMGDALSAGLAGDTAKYAEALKKLTPNAQAAVRSFVGLREQFQGIKSLVQENFFAGISEQIDTLGSTLVPTLERGLGGLASALGAQFSTLLSSIQAPETLSALDGIFANVTAAADAFAPAIGNIVTAFLSFANVTSGFLPALGAGLADATAQFSAFIQEAAASGQIADLFSTLAQRAGQMFDLFVSGIQPILGLLRGLAPGVGAVVESLAGSFSILTGPLTQVGQLISQFLTALAPLIPVIFQLAGAILSALVAAIGPLIEPLTELIGAILPVLIDFFNQLAPVLADIAAAFAEVLVAEDFADALSGLVEPLIALVQLFGDFIVAMAPLIPVILELAAVILDALVAALEPLIEPITELISALLPVLKEVFEALAPVLVDLATVFGELVTALIPLIEPIADLVVELLPHFSELLQALPPLIEALVPIIQAFADVMSFLVPVIGGVVGFIVDAFTLLITVVTAVINGISTVVTTVFTAIRDFITNIWNGIKTFFSTTLDQIKGIFTGAWDGLKNTVSNAASAIGTAVSDLVRNIVDFFKGLPGRLLQIGKDMIQGLIDGIKAMVKRVVDAVTGVINDALAAANALLGINSPSKVMRQMGVYSGQGLAQGLRAMIPTVRRAGLQLAGAIPSIQVPTLAMGAMPGSGGLAFGSGGRPWGSPVTTNSRSVTVNQNISMPVADPSAFLAISGAHARAAASKLMR